MSLKTWPAVTKHQPIEPVVGKVAGEDPQGLRIASLARVVIRVEQQHAPDAQQPRAVWITHAVGEGVMLAMHGHPLLTLLSGGEPEHDPEERVGRRVHDQRSVGQSAVQIDGGREHGDLGQHDAHDRCAQHGQGHRSQSPALSARFIALRLRLRACACLRLRLTDGFS